MGHEHDSISHSERAEFNRLTRPLDIELDAILEPTDGWDPVPRPNPLANLELDRVREDGRKYIPQGHIALQGDFDSEG